jgi:hypothetical protein
MALFAIGVAANVELVAVAAVEDARPAAWRFAGAGVGNVAGVGPFLFGWWHPEGTRFGLVHLVACG